MEGLFSGARELGYVIAKLDTQELQVSPTLRLMLLLNFEVLGCSAAIAETLGLGCRCLLVKRLRGRFEAKYLNNQKRDP
jgi:hypothetical protein